MSGAFKSFVDLLDNGRLVAEPVVARAPWGGRCSGSRVPSSTPDCALSRCFAPSRVGSQLCTRLRRTPLGVARVGANRVGGRQRSSAPCSPASMRAATSRTSRVTVRVSAGRSVRSDLDLNATPRCSRRLGGRRGRLGRSAAIRLQPECDTRPHAFVSRRNFAAACRASRFARQAGQTRGRFPCVSSSSHLG
jgi:hypothetical protein